LEKKVFFYNQLQNNLNNINKYDNTTLSKVSLNFEHCKLKKYNIDSFNSKNIIEFSSKKDKLLVVTVNFLITEITMML